MCKGDTGRKTPSSWTGSWNINEYRGGEAPLQPVIALNIRNDETLLDIRTTALL
jgi:hypothetical protein